MKRPLAVVGFSVAAAFFAAPLLPWWLAVSAATVCLLTAVLTIAIRPLRLPAAVWAALLCIGAAFFYYGWRDRAAFSPLTAREDAAVALTATVDELPVLYACGVRYVLRVREGALPSGTRLLLYAAANEVCCEAGDTVSGVFTITPADGAMSLPDRLAAKADGCLWQAVPQGAVTAVEYPADWQTAVLRLRAAACRRIDERFVPSVAGVLRSVCLGDRVGLLTADRTAYRRAGLSHLLAVSGLHLSIVTGAIYGLLRALRCRRRFAAGLTMLSALLFMALTGFSGSVTRAGIMAILLFAGKLVFRESDSLNAIGFSLLVMLLLNPFAAWDRGLQLSVAATLGVVCGYPRLHEAVTAGLLARLPASSWAVRPLRFVADSVCLSVCAAVPTLIPIAWWFGAISVLAPLANLAAIPIAGVTVAAGLAYSLFGGIPLLGDGIAVAAGIATRLQTAIAALVARVPVAEVPVAGATAWILLIGGLAMLFLCRYTLVRRSLACGCFAAVTLITLLADWWMTPALRVTALPMDHDVAICLQLRGQTAVFAAFGADDAASRLSAALADVGVTRLDCLVLTDADRQGVRRLDEFSERWPDAAIYLPQAGENLAVVTGEVPAERLHFSDGTVTVWQTASFSRYRGYASLFIAGERYLLAYDGAVTLTEPETADVAVCPVFPPRGFDCWTVERITVNGLWRATGLPVYATVADPVILQETN